MNPSPNPSPNSSNLERGTNTVVARLTVTRQNGWKTIVEVQADASFSSFYHYYRQFGLKRSTKALIRTANRNEGLGVMNARMQQPGLDVIAKRLEAYGQESNPVTGRKLRIIKKRIYRKLLSAAPDVIGQVKVKPIQDPRLMPRPVLGYPIHIPESHTMIAKKWSILTGRG